MRIAIASSGLGHIARGVETWAMDTAAALARAQTADPKGCKALGGRTLREPFFVSGSGKPRPPEESAVSPSLSVTLFCAASLPAAPCLLATVNCSLPPVRVLPCWKRGDRLVKLLVWILPGFTWRWGWKSAYDIEQRSFWRHLWPILKDEEYDILHVQDPLLADLCRQYRKAGKLRTKEILAHGTEEPLEFLEKFDYLQELTPEYAARHTKPRRGQIIGIAPNFVDTNVFVPDGDRKDACRNNLGIPRNAFVVLSVGSINRERKRMDYLVSEFGKWDRKDAVLVIAGACDSSESKALVVEARELLGERLVVLEDLPRERMPDIYAAADVFVLCAQKELFGIAFLEAMACGLPCIGHNYPVTEWVIGVERQTADIRPQTVDQGEEKDLEQKHAKDAKGRNGFSAGGGGENASLRSSVQNSSLTGGLAIDMSKEGALAQALAGLTPEWLALHGRQARMRVEKMFSSAAVIGQYIEFYRAVLKCEKSGGDCV